jgi:hypothetical protein
MRLKTVALLALYLQASHSALQAQGVAQAQVASVGQPSFMPAEVVTGPPQFTEQQLAALERMLTTVNLPPSQGSQPAPPAGPTGPETTPNPAPAVPSPSEGPSEANVAALPLRISVAEAGSHIFYTGNLLAARYKAGAPQSRSYINPSSGMSDFCCEQAVIADRSRDLLLWYRQGVYDPVASSSRFVLSSSKDGGRSFCSYSVQPSDLDSRWTERSWQSADLGISGEHLFVSANLHLASGFFDRKVTLRWPLQSLDSCSGSAINMQRIPWRIWQQISSADTSIQCRRSTLELHLNAFFERAPAGAG